LPKENLKENVQSSKSEIIVRRPKINKFNFYKHTIKEEVIYSCLLIKSICQNEIFGVNSSI